LIFFTCLENLCYTLPMPSVIRASEIGSYLYCRRAWWYQKQGIQSENQAELATGTKIHLQHGRKVLTVGLFRTIGLVLLLVAFILLAAYLAMHFI
jgi:CRISPR/Cas system-associated exonuclease Cas4 (RecB family)